MQAWTLKPKPLIPPKVEHFASLEGMTDLGVAFTINEAKPDILIEMVGWYPEQRSGIVAHRPARVQVLSPQHLNRS